MGKKVNLKADELCSKIAAILGMNELPLKFGTCPQQPDDDMCGVCILRNIDALFAAAVKYRGMNMKKFPQKIKYSIKLNVDSIYRLEILKSIMSVMKKWSPVVSSASGKKSRNLKTQTFATTSDVPDPDSSTLVGNLRQDRLGQVVDLTSVSRRLLDDDSNKQLKANQGVNSQPGDIIPPNPEAEGVQSPAELELSLFLEGDILDDADQSTMTPLISVPHSFFMDDVNSDA
jgi:hypothetical protein